MVLIYGEPVKKWTCIYTACGAKCCEGEREVTLADVKRISKALSLKPEEFLKSLEGKGGIFRLKSKNGKCVFLQGGYACRLHHANAKPLLCQMYPFRFSGIIYADEAILKIQVMKECPGLGKGKSIGKEFEAKIEELGNRFIKEVEEFLRLQKVEEKSVREMLKGEGADRGSAPKKKGRKGKPRKSK